MDMVLASRRDGRAHDVTCFIVDDRGRVAVIRKHFHPPGVWRAPSGGVHAGEDPEEGIRREMREETGLDVRLARYLLRIDATFVSGEGDGRREQAWVSHVFAARPASPGPEAGEIAPGPEGKEAAEIALDPEDREEIACARWVTIDELQGPIRQALLDTGRGLFRYRVLLTDLAVAALAEMEPPGGSAGCVPPARL
ncbi:MAG: NUDIX hydrolase [Firmicutes bacterium]|nr:NUDIX hydrolase [Bacillota bacterium]